MAVHQIRDIDRGWKKLLREALRRGAYVEVGILGPKALTAKGHAPAPRGMKKRDKRPAAPAGARATVADVATFLHEGTSTIPARPFISGWFDENREANRRFARKLAEQRLLGADTYEGSLKKMGAYAQGGIQKRMAAGWAPPNADSTIARKGSSKPLINTGQLRSSVAFRIVNGSLFGGAR